MTAAYLRLISHRPIAWAVVLITLVWSLVFGALSIGVESDDDVLKFLPQSNPEIRAFYEINKAFGSTDVAIVGIASPDVFSADFLGRLKAVTSEIKGTSGVDHALSITNVADFVKDTQNGGILSGTLVSDLPTDAASAAAVRAKVMSRDHIVGNLVSKDGGAVVLYAWVGPGHPPREVARAVRAVVEKAFPTEEKVWGGAPFISSYIYDTTEADLARLTPWSIAAILFIIMAAFRDIVGTILGVVTTGIGIITANGLMALAGEPFNIVLSSMPVILFATGSAYGVHTLAKYYQHAEEFGPGPKALEATIVGDAGNVIAAGLTTVAGMWSLCFMDIEPMRVFGLYTGLGIIASLVSALTLVPAIMVLFPRPHRPSHREKITEATTWLAQQARAHRKTSIAAIAVITVVGGGFVSRVDTRMDIAAFFDKGSEPAESLAFLQERFGGSQFVQIRVAGDLQDPLVLREVARVADRISVLPHVSSVQGVQLAMEIINDAMSGARRIPDTSGQTGVLYRFLSSDPAVQRLITDERNQALLVIKLDTDDSDALQATLEEIEALVSTSAATKVTTTKVSADPTAARAQIGGLISARITALAHRAGVAVAAPVDGAVNAFLAEAEPVAPAAAVAQEMTAFLSSSENFVTLTPEQSRAVADALAALGSAASPELTRAAIAGAVVGAESPTIVDDLVMVVEGPLRDTWRAENAKVGADLLLKRLAITPPAGPEGERFVAAVASKLQDRGNTEWAGPDTDQAHAVAWTVSGQPVLYRGLSKSVTQNQFASLGSSLLMCFLIMTVMLRSPFSGLLATMPTVVTLVLIYGAMGAAGVHLDIGTSMIASMVVGTAVDYALHILSSWEARPEESIPDAIRRAVEDSGFAIWTNAIMVAAGFFVLTLGDARPLRNVGSLTAAGMIISALATFVVIPVLANKRRYR